MLRLRGVAVWHEAAPMGADQPVRYIHLGILHVPHDFHRLSDILVGHAVHVTLGTHADMVGARQLHLLAQAEAVHAVRQREHLRLFILLKDLTARAAFVRQRAILLQQLPYPLVKGIEAVKILTLYTGIDVLVELVYSTFHRPFVTRLAYTACKRLDAVVEGPLHIGGSVGQAVAVRLRHPLLHVVALGNMGDCTKKLQPIVQAVEEPFRRGIGQCHHEGQVTIRHHAHQHHELLSLFGPVVCQIERVARKVDLSLLARLVLVVIRVVVFLTVLAHIFLELSVAIAIRKLLLIVVVKDVLQVGVLAA